MRNWKFCFTLSAIALLSSTTHAQSQFTGSTNSPFSSPGDRFGTVMVGGMEGASTSTVPFHASYTNVLSNIVHEPAFIVGAKNFNQRRGGVTVLSTATGQELWLPAQRLVGGAPGDYLGASVGVAPDLFDTAGNLTGDGIPDLIVGAPQTPTHTLTSGPTGYVKLTSSAGTGSVVLQGLNSNEQFGIKVGAIGDRILITANRTQIPSAPSLAGRIYIYRAADILAQQSTAQPSCILSGLTLTTSSQSADRFGYSWVYMPNGPGNTPTIAVGAPYGGTSGEQRGKIYLFNLAAIQTCTGGANLVGTPLNFDPDPILTELSDSRMFGEALTTDPTGSSLIVGAPQRTLFNRFGDQYTAESRFDQIGAAYIFRNMNLATAAQPPTPEILYGPLRQGVSFFGRALALTDTKLFVGSADDGPNTLAAPGSISIYDMTHEQTTYSHLVHAVPPQAGNFTGNFGASIAVGGTAGDVIAVGDSGVENGTFSDSKVYRLNLNGLGSPLVSHYGDGCARVPGTKAISTVMGRPIIGEELSAFVQNIDGVFPMAPLSYLPGPVNVNGPNGIPLPIVACVIPGINPGALFTDWFAFNPEAAPAMYAGTAAIVAPVPATLLGFPFITATLAIDPGDWRLYTSNYQQVTITQW